MSFQKNKGQDARWIKDQMRPYLNMWADRYQNDHKIPLKKIKKLMRQTIKEIDGKVYKKD